MPDLSPNYPAPYLGEIRIFAARVISIDAGWHLCDGSLLKMEEYPELFALIGTTYGGDGQTTFALPDLRGRVPLHLGGSYGIGMRAGQETVILTQAQLPAHTHTVNTSKSEPLESPENNFWGVSNSNPYADPPGTISLNATSIKNYGFSYAHENRIPFQAVNFIIALRGIWPSPNTKPPLFTTFSHDTNTLSV